MAEGSSTGAPYTTEQLAPVREALLARRARLVETEQAHGRGLADAQRRGPAVEEEEAAAHQHTEFVAARVREGLHRELRLLDAALSRLGGEGYGRCDECGEPIALERLRALPYTRLCAADAARDERDKAARSQGRGLTF